MTLTRIITWLHYKNDLSSKTAYKQVYKYAAGEKKQFSQHSVILNDNLYFCGHDLNEYLVEFFLCFLKLWRWTLHLVASSLAFGLLKLSSHIHWSLKVLLGRVAS